MNIRAALKEQCHAGLAMLAQCVEKCPRDLWVAPAPRLDDGDRVIYRAFWRIAFHDAYFTHLYLGQNEAAFEPPPANLAVRREDTEAMWRAPWDLEPYEMPEDAEPFTQKDILEYIAFVDGLVDRTVDTLDLDSNESGFFWYPGFDKLSHELMNVRHIQDHVGQLSELLMGRGIQTDWIGKPGRRWN